MVHLLIIQLRSILNGMIMNNLVINNNILSNNIVLFQMSTVLIIFVFGDCNGCKNNGNTIVGINIHAKSYIFMLKRYLNNTKSISVALIFCLISIPGDARTTKLYLSRKYGNDDSYLVTFIDRCLECDYITNNNIFVNIDNFNTDYGIFNPSVRFTVIHVIHDNYTIQGYGNNSEELIILILRDYQAEGSNMLDLSTS